MNWLDRWRQNRLRKYRADKISYLYRIEARENNAIYLWLLANNCPFCGGHLLLQVQFESKDLALRELKCQHCKNFQFTVEKKSTVNTDGLLSS